MPLGMLADGTMYCYWRMPFRTEAVFELQNLSTEP